MPVSARTLHGILVFFLLNGCAGATGLTGPRSGYVFDPRNESVVPIIGVPGGSQLGSPVVQGLKKASIAPNGRTALALLEDGVYWFQDVERNEPLRIDSLAKWPDLVAWSGDSSAAVLYFSEEHSIRILTRESVPEVRTVETPGFEEPITALATASGGRAVLFAIGDGASRVFRIGDEGAISEIGSFDGPVRFSSSSDGRRVFVMERSGRLLSVDLAAGYGIQEILAAEVSLPEPVGVQEQGDKIYVAYVSTPVVRAYQLPAASPIHEIALDSPPDGLTPISATRFLLTQPGIAPVLWLFDAGATPGAYFVATGQGRE
jgi:hypothetical protein